MPRTLHVEYAARGQEYGILFVFSLFGEYSHLEYVRLHVIHRVDQAEYVVHILMVAPHKYVNIYSTCRPQTAFVMGALPMSAGGLTHKTKVIMV